MTGGNATHSGIGFQDKVAAIMAIYALADEPLPIFGLPSGVTLTTVDLETNAPVDDILVKTSANGFCFINVKRSVMISNNPRSPLGSVIDQFVRQWIACLASAGNREWERPLDKDKDRLVLVTGGTRAQTFVSAISNILTRVTDRHSILPKEDIAITRTERRVYDTLLSLIRDCWNRHTGNTPSDDDIVSFLSITKVIFADPDYSDKTPALSLLRKVVLVKPNDADNVWTHLVAKCHRLAKDQSGADRSTLRDTLRNAGFQLQHIPMLEGDINRLEAFTGDTLKCLEHLACLPVPTSSGIQDLKINRKVTQVLVDCAKSTSLLLVSEPGAGKSGALYWAAKQLREQSYPVVVVAVDRHPVESMERLVNDLGLDGSLFDALKGWTTSKPGVFFIDALDATRGGPSDKVFQELIKRILTEVPGWRVVASIRLFDLRFGLWYRDLFAGTPLDKEFCDPEFNDVRHLLIRSLLKEELDQVWLKSPVMNEVYQQATEPLRELLHNPFNLYLLAKILTTGGRQEDFSGISTQIGLLDRYWSHRVIGSDRKGLEREKLLRCFAEEMIDRRVLFVTREIIEKYNGQNIDRLMSDGVLSPAKRRGDHVIHASFSHHMLFDYAVAKLVFECGHASDLVDRLTASDDRALLMAPAAMIAFRMLWYGDNSNRSTFWEKAFNVAGAEGTGAFCRMLPARVAAELTRQLEDFAPIIECLRKKECIHKKAACFLVRHCLGALAAGIVSEQRTVGPNAAEWCQIVRALAEAAIEEVGLALKPVISQWIKQPEKVTYVQKQDLGEASRRLLILGSGAVYDEGAVIIGIQAVARTFETAPIEFYDTLKLLLTPDHVSMHGHKELFWLSQEFDYLIIHEPKGTELLAELYRAAYCTPLPSRDEATNMGGSRILSLISNKRQDFEMSRHILGKKFVSFTEAQPVLAAEVLIDVMECIVHEGRHRETEVAEFSFGGIQAQYQKDWSYMWTTHRDDDEHSLLQGFIEGIGRAVQAKQEPEIDATIQAVVRRNSLACIWASLLDVGAAHPYVIGKRLLPLLAAPIVLAGIDTRKPAGDLLTVLHPLLASDEKRIVEGAILATEREETQRILLGCLNSDNVVLEEARQRRMQFESEGPLPENRKPFSFEVGRTKGDEDWWLRDQGVDISVIENATLNNTIKEVEAIKSPSSDNASSRMYFGQHWEIVRKLLLSMQSTQAIPEALRMKGWDALTEVATKAAQSCDSAEDLTTFCDIEDMVLGALQDSLWPLPESDTERENSFARFPSWSSPSPRNAGAAALMALARAKNKTDPIHSDLIKKLAIDPSPEVRYQILSRVNMLFNADSELMWWLCEHAFGKERNVGILSSFLNSITRIIGSRPEWFTTRLLNLMKDISGGDKESRNRIDEVYVWLILRLWLVYDQTQAGEQIYLWLKDPIKYTNHVLTSLTSLRTAIVQGTIERPDPIDERIRSRAIEVFHSVVMKTVPVFIELASRSSLDETELKLAETALRIIDQAATEIYFGSGAYDARHGDEKLIATPAIRQRFLQEMKPTLEALTDAAYPSITHHLLETLEAYIPVEPTAIFRLVVRALTVGGRTGGYQYESMGAELFVRIIRRYLADYRAALTQEEECRQGLMSALDIFVDVGWPEARRLVYELPEMLR